MIEGVEPPDCPNDTNVRACDADEVCPDPLVLCGRVWPGCRLVCAPDEIPGGVHCARDEVDCDPTTCDEEDPSCTQSPTPGVACYAAHCADEGPRCSDLDAAYLECEEPSVCVELFACGRVQRCRIDD